MSTQDKYKLVVLLNHVYDRARYWISPGISSAWLPVQYTASACAGEKNGNYQAGRVTIQLFLVALGAQASSKSEKPLTYLFLFNILLQYCGGIEAIKFGSLTTIVHVFVCCFSSCADLSYVYNIIALHLYCGRCYVKCSLSARGVCIKTCEAGFAT